MGGDPEKLLTLEEAAQWLHCPADDLEAMIQSGVLPAFRLGGTLLRVRLKDVEQLHRKRPPTEEPQRADSFLHRMTDFLYFNDFYLVVALVILTLLALIFAL